MHAIPKPTPRRGPDPPLEPLLNVKQLAELLGRSPHAIRLLYVRGRLPPAIKVGRLLAWEPRDIREWMERRKG